MCCMSQCLCLLFCSALMCCLEEIYSVVNVYLDHLCINGRR